MVFSRVEQEPPSPDIAKHLKATNRKKKKKIPDVCAKTQ
jgi:hypothetical protein